METSSARTDDQTPLKKFNLEKEYELRFEVDFGFTVFVTLIQGTAEVFGTELALERKYSFTGTKVAVFTWHGCSIEITGQCHAYVANETPMVSYMNVYAVLEERRMTAKSIDGTGPRVMIVGPADTGKTSISKILLSYAARRSHQPIFVDLDIGQGSITVPGTISAIHVDRPIDVEEGFAMTTPIVYFFGHVTPAENEKLYKLQIDHLARDIDLCCEANKEIRSSGVVINTCGWVDGLGYQLLLYSLRSLKVDVVLVIDHERLYNDLLQEISNSKTPDGTGAYSPIKSEIIKLAKSGGVVTRPTQFRRKTRMRRIREYFYGPAGDLCPHSTVLDFRNVHLYRIGSAPQAPVSALPIGSAPTIDPVKLSEVTPSNELLHSVIGVSLASSPDKIIETNLAGFLYVTEVHLDKNKFTVLAPCPGPLPSKYLVVGSLKWIE